MGFFSSSKPKETLPWIQLESLEQLEEVVKTTNETPILLFKHSTRCSISSMALHSFERDWSTGDSLCKLYFLDLLAHRPVSNEIAAITGVQHQSPQAIVLKGSEVVYEATHSSISARSIESILRKA